MKTVLVTGANGFIGKNLVSTLERIPDIEVLKFRSEHSVDQLKRYVSKTDFVFHLAGVNRPQIPSDYHVGNAGFTEQLVAQMIHKGAGVPLVFASSTQASLDNPYGNSKKDAEQVVLHYHEMTGASIYTYRLPNVFGKWCKPNYNSVVATWCYNISRGMSIQINNPDTVLQLVYIDDIVSEFVSILQGILEYDPKKLYSVEPVYTITLQQLARTLYEFKESRITLKLPNLSDELDRKLYSTYLSYLAEDDFGYDLEMKRDNRGWLAEFVKSQTAGQIFISRTIPGITRGNHWHHTKVEKFLVIEGEAIIKFRQIHGEHIIEYKVSGNQLKVLDIPPGYTHSITNIGDGDVITLFWANEIFDSERPDTYFLEV